MIQNEDGSVILTPDDVRGVTALLDAANRHIRDAGFFVSESATKFAGDWGMLATAMGQGK